MAGPLTPGVSVQSSPHLLPAYVSCSRSAPSSCFARKSSHFAPARSPPRALGLPPSSCPSCPAHLSCPPAPMGPAAQSPCAGPWRTPAHALVLRARLPWPPTPQPLRPLCVPVGLGSLLHSTCTSGCNYTAGGVAPARVRLPGDPGCLPSAQHTSGSQQRFAEGGTVNASPAPTPCPPACPPPS